MTEIVRASLGLPALRAGPQFRNSKPQHDHKKRISNMFGSLKMLQRAHSPEPAGAGRG
jgi:hypothetical protein